MDGTSGNKFPAAEPPSPGLEVLDFLSGAFWKVMLVLVAVRKTKVVVVVAVGTEVRPHPQEVRAQGARVCVPWPSLPSYRGAQPGPAVSREGPRPCLGQLRLLSGAGRGGSVQLRPKGEDLELFTI